MPSRSDPSALRWLIGHELRLARERAGKKQVDAARELECSQGKITYLEMGRNKQQPDEVTKLLNLYGAGVAHVERLASLAGRADQGTWWADFQDVVPNWFATFVGLEGLASSQFVYEIMTVPGLLQTPDYASALLSGHLRIPVVDVDQVVNLRMARRGLLDTAIPLQLRIVVEESVLDREVGGREVMQEQLRYLHERAQQDNITIQVMPLSIPVHDGVDGEFMLLEFDHARGVGYIEYPNGAVYVQDHDQVFGYTKAAERLCSAALSPAESLNAIATRII